VTGAATDIFGIGFCEGALDGAFEGAFVIVVSEKLAS
jgi:hypothetical protein